MSPLGWQKTLVWVLAGILGVLAQAQSAPGNVQSDRPASALLEGVPHIRQKPDFCGEACVAMWMQKLGLKATQDWVFEQSTLNPVMGRGCYTRELVDTLQRIKFKPGPVWTTVRRGDPKAVAAQFQALVEDLRRGVPSIVCMHYDDQPHTTEHFRLVLGYDQDRDQVVYHEPAESRGAYRRMSRSAFLRRWPLDASATEWSLIRMRLEAKATELKVPKMEPGLSQADYCQHVMKVKERLPKGFHLYLSHPFVVVGDGEEAKVWQAASGTVAWAVQKLKERYFKEDPKEIITVWLFKDKASYEKHTWSLFKEKPDTPYGYYSAKDRALVMNISTGGGTLVHEIVHPFMRANFPTCPAWFNEGMGSLYEHCGESNGQIIGKLNWRLPILQEGLRAGHVQDFRTFMALADTPFYEEDPHDTHYAQARYLCYYLQEKGLLQTFYQRFTRDAKTDPTGYHTLVKLLGNPDMAAWQKEWRTWVLALKVPE